MNPTGKAFREVSRLIEFLKTTNSRELHLRAYETAIRIGVPEEFVWQALAWFTVFGGIRLTTWSQTLWREIHFQEWPAAAFFYNREDSSYVRLRPAEA